MGKGHRCDREHAHRVRPLPPQPAQIAHRPDRESQNAASALLRCNIARALALVNCDQATADETILGRGKTRRCPKLFHGRSQASSDVGRARARPGGCRPAKHARGRSASGQVRSVRATKHHSEAHSTPVCDGLRSFELVCQRAVYLTSQTLIEIKEASYQLSQSDPVQRLGFHRTRGSPLMTGLGMDPVRCDSLSVCPALSVNGQHRFEIK